MLAFSALIVGMLPPGYEDEAWCPPDHCLRAKPREPGIVEGGSSSFFECAHIVTGEAARAFWTGALGNAVPLPGLVKVESFLDASFKRVECDTSAGAVGGGAAVGALGPAWTRGEIEAPQGEKSMGSWTAGVYTSEQQARMGVDEEGKPATRRAAPPPFAIHPHLLHSRASPRSEPVEIISPISQTPTAVAGNDNPPSFWRRVQAKVLGLFRLR